jgi:hypothetical protein
MGEKTRIIFRWQIYAQAAVSGATEYSNNNYRADMDWRPVQSEDCE